MSQFVLPAVEAAKLGIKSFQKTSKLSLELFKYDFFGLAIKLVVYFAFAWIINQYLRWINGDTNTRLAVIFGALGGLPLFGLAQWLIDLLQPKEVKTGVKYWDIVKGVAFLLVAWEAYNYYESNQKTSSPMTLGIFGLILALLGLSVVPDIITKLKESNVIKT